MNARRPQRGPLAARNGRGLLHATGFVSGIMHQIEVTIGGVVLNEKREALIRAALTVLAYAAPKGFKVTYST